jgi:Flp pilus assembly protein TadG
MSRERMSRSLSASTTAFVRRLFRTGNLLLRETGGSAILEFAVTLPLLAVFIVGIYDFSAAFDQKQKLAQAAQEGAIVAAAQPTSDLYSDLAPNASPSSLQPVVTAVFNSLAGSGVLATGACTPPWPVSGTSAMTWTYTMACPTDNLVIAVNRGWVCSACATAPPPAVGTTVTVTYPYHWRFNSVIQLLFPGSHTYAAVTTVTESATVPNQT